MATSEIPFRFAAGFEEEYSPTARGARLRQERRQRFDVVCAELGSGTLAYIAVSPGAKPNEGLENRLAVKDIGDDTVELRIEKPIAPIVVAALAQVAFEKIIREKSDAEVIGLATRHLDNQEVDENMDPTFAVLGMEGLGEMTDSGELQYRGDARGVLWMATNALEQHRPPYRKVAYPPGEVA